MAGNGSSPSRITYTFSSSHHALWAEDLAREAEIPIEVGSPPSGSSDVCGIAIRIDSDRADDLELRLNEAEIAFTRWDGV